MTELKRCPFCGGIKFEYDNDTGPGDDGFWEWWYCSKCGMKFTDKSLWNTRPIEDELNARIKELEHVMGLDLEGREIK
jgi:hypothetical protein